MRLCHHYYPYFFIIMFIINSIIIIIIYFGSSATRYHRRHHHDRLAMEFFATPRCPDAPDVPGGSSAALHPPAPPLTLRTSDDHAWPLVPGVYGPLGPIPHDMSLAPLADAAGPQDHVLLVLNDARAPILAKEGWPRRGRQGSTTPSSSRHEGEELAKDVAAKLRKHPLCQNAWFLPSRGSFKILRTDKKYFEVGIPDVQKLQKKDKVDTGDLAWQPFETTVIQTYAKALGVLNAETNMALEPFLGGVLNAETNKALETKNPEFGIDLGTKKREETMPRPSQRQRLLTESWVG